MQLPQKQSFGSSFGAGLGQGFSSGINSIIDMKLEKMKEQQQIKQVEDSLASYMGPDKAKAFAPLAVRNPQLAGMVLKDALEGPGQQMYNEAITGKKAPTEGMAPQAPTAAPIAQALEAATPAQTEAPIAPSPEATAAAPIAQAPAPIAQAPVPITKASMVKKLTADIKRMKAALPDAIKNYKKYVPKLQSQINQKERELSNLIINSEKENLKEKQFNYKIQQDKAKNKIENVKLDLQIAKAKDDKSQQALVNKKEDRKRLDTEYGPYYKNQTNNFRTTSEDLYALEAMNKINKDPNMAMDSPAWQSITSYAKKLGIPEGTLQGTPTQIMQKLIADFNFRTAKSFAGTGIRAAVIIQEAFKKNPGLYQSPEARQYVIGSLTKLTKLKSKEAKMAMDMKKNNNYQYTDGFSEKILERMMPEYEKLANGFEKRINSLKKDKKLQTMQSKYERQQLGATIGGGAGMVAGAVPGMLAGARVGGRVGGPLGAGAGALIGGVGGYLAGGQIGSKISEYFPKKASVKKVTKSSRDIKLEKAKKIEFGGKIIDLSHFSKDKYKIIKSMLKGEL